MHRQGVLEYNFKQNINSGKLLMDQLNWKLLNINTAHFITTSLWHGFERENLKKILVLYRKIT